MKRKTEQARTERLRAAWQIYREKQRAVGVDQRAEPPTNGTRPRREKSSKRWIADNCIAGELLDEFWTDWECKISQEGRLALLVDMANKFRGRVGAKNLLRRRKQYEALKKQLSPPRKTDCATKCGRHAELRHHIIPLSMGGSNRRKNLIAICGNCHAIIHPWLAAKLPRKKSETMARVAREPDALLAAAA